MSKSKKANEVRTILLLKIQSEINNFIKSETLINTISPKEIYKLYGNIEIFIENSYEFSTKKSKENQKKFYDDSQMIENESITPYMEIFRTINKILISEKKNKTFYDRLDLDEKEIEKISNENKKFKYATPIELLSNINKKDQTNLSIKYLRQKAKNLINIISRRKITNKTHSKSFYQNPAFKSQGNLRINKKKNTTLLKKTKNKFTKEFQLIENEIINSSPITYSSNIEGKKKNGKLKHTTFRSSTNLSNNDNISKISYVSYSNRYNSNFQGILTNNNKSNNSLISPSKFSRFAKKTTI
jgi:hypothetical protein